MIFKEYKNLKIVVSIVLGILTIGTVGYMRLLDVSVIDALYMTVITISTVGYTEVGEMTDAAKIFSMIIIFMGLGTVGYSFTRVVTFFIEGAFKETWRRRKMEKQIAELKNHYILCGAGETGQSVISQFEKSKVDFVVIEEKEKVVNELLERGILVIHGDGTHEEALKKARIKEAKGLVSALPEDALNVFTVLTARQMNENLYIVSRAVEVNSREKLKKAGANNTISPNEIGGMRMASFVIRPAVISFLDIITHAGDVILDLEDVLICDTSKLKGQSLKEAKIPERTGLIVLAVQKKGESTPRLNPSYDEILDSGDAMIVLGQEDQVNKLRQIACDSGKRDPINRLKENQ
ncbi:potassium channel protein [Serpentinicella sp. ANB-PHB4]|uniref:potassium channel family protein n=1 Tax=Serpentinicella sp. ANB-PHB4 TaxID=3074076 RepID=UPI00286078FE|nr:potassium channel protein [Serpentinicella sp. ANB-PHB4]MDR5660039.1 potassium channel protein [Serpentinicella sp. ANB-PHB4]